MIILCVTSVYLRYKTPHTLWSLCLHNTNCSVSEKLTFCSLCSTNINVYEQYCKNEHVITLLTLTVPVTTIDAL